MRISRCVSVQDTRVGIENATSENGMIVSVLTLLARISQCAVEGALFPVGANPTRQLSLRPVPPGAVQGGNELD